MAEVACEEYASSLNDLTFNSKPHISMLTMLAEENVQYAPDIVRVIEAHLQKVRPEAKLPAIYLIDSIVKNIRGEYLSLFTQNLVSTFCSVFEKVDEKTRLQLYKLRQTWMDVFPNKKLYAIDMRVRQMDPAWPISAQASIHVNPKFLKNSSEEESQQRNNQELQEAEMRKQLIAKQQELLRLQQQKLELELLQTKAKLDEQKRLLQHPPVDEMANKLEEVKLVIENAIVSPPLATSTVSIQPKMQLPAQILPPVAVQMPMQQHLGVVSKDPRLLRDPRMLRDPKFLPAAQNTTMNVPSKQLDSFVSSKPMDVQIKLEPKQSGNLMKQMQANAGMAMGPGIKQFFGKDARNEIPKIPKKKEFGFASSKGESKLGGKRKGGGRDSKKMRSDQSDAKKDQKKKFDSISPKKSPELKKETLKDSTDKRKVSDKKGKVKTEGRDGEKSRKSSDRKGNSNRSSSVKKDHDFKKVDAANRRGSFRNRRNYRSNRDRSESPENKTEAVISPTTGGADINSDVRKDGQINRSRSPVRKNFDGGKHHKKMLATGDSKWAEGGTQEDAGKENKMELGDVSVTDVDLRVGADSPTRNNRIKGKRDVEDMDLEEPQAKRMRHGSDEDKGGLNSLFGSKDQDYRQIPPNEKTHGRCGRSGWAQYKAEHPDEFKKSPHPLRGNRQQDFVGFRPYDMDLRMECEFGPAGGHVDPNSIDNKMGKFPGMNQIGPDRSRGFRFTRSNDPRLMRGGFGRSMRQSNRLFDDMRNLRRHPMYGRYNTEFENTHPGMNIPNALLLDRRAEILRQADQQLKSGHLTQEQHRELLNQLAKLYELQLLRQKQREEQFCENFLPARSGYDQQGPSRKGYQTDFEGGNPYPPEDSRFRHSPVQNQFGEMSPSESDVQLGERKAGSATRPGRRISMLSIFQRENQTATTVPVTTSDDDLKTGTKLSSPADDSDRFIGIDGKTMKLKYFGCVAVIIEGTKAQEILFRGTRREIFVDGNIVLLGFEGDEQTFYVNEKSHTMKFGTPTHEIYIDNIPYEARFGGPPIRILLDEEPHEIRLGNPPPDVELKELSPDIEAEVMKFIETCSTDKQPVSEVAKSVDGEVLSDKPVEESSKVDLKVEAEKSDNAQPEDMEICEESVDKSEIILPQSDEVEKSEEEVPLTGPAVVDDKNDDKLEMVGKPTSPRRDEPADVAAKVQLDGEQEVSQFTTYHGVQTRNFVGDSSRPEFPEFQRRPFHPEDDHEYRERGFDSEMGFKEGPGIRDYPHREKGGRDWSEPWREKNPYRDDRVIQPWNYNICNTMDTQPSRDEFWSHNRKEDFSRRNQFYNRDQRGNLKGSPQRGGQPDYGHYRDTQQRRDFVPPYGATNRMDNRMRFDMVRPPFDNRSRFDNWQRFDNIRPRNDGRRPNMRQPHPYFQPGPMDMQQKPVFPGRTVPDYYPDGGRGYPDARPEMVEANVQPNQPVPAFPFAGPSQTTNALPSSLDVGELFQKLVAAGILAGSTSTADAPVEDGTKAVAAAATVGEPFTSGEGADGQDEKKPEEQDDYCEKVPPIEFTSECLRTRYDGVIAKLCRGIQCASCGLRFMSEQSEKYAQHLDWHFRHNRRERDSAKKAMSRKWYYDVQDWIQFEEIEDMEERARSVFEDQTADEQPDRLDDVQTIPVAENDEDNMCTVCGESFEQFWDEDKEEWHLRDAMRVDNKSYHPMCYEDIRNISLKSESESEAKDKEDVEQVEVAMEVETAPEEVVPEMVIKQEIEEPEGIVIKEEPLSESDPIPAAGDPQPVTIKEEPKSPPLPPIAAAATTTTVCATEPVKDEVLEPLATELEHLSVDSQCLLLPIGKDIGVDPSIVVVKREPDTDVKQENANSNPESINKGANPEPPSSQSIELAETSQIRPAGEFPLGEIKMEGKEIMVGMVGPAGVVQQATTSLLSQDGDDESAGPSAGRPSRDPTPVPPGPEFIILPPVMRGTELSGLCSIM